jgi:hypothetical protein
LTRCAAFVSFTFNVGTLAKLTFKPKLKPFSEDSLI